MRKYYGITAPVWIFLFTLVLIVASGRLVGSSPCERTLRTCESTAVQAHTNNLMLQQAYISRCSEAACKNDKSGAAVPFSLLVFGAVLYVVWRRQGATEEKASPAPTGTIETAVPTAGTEPETASEAPPAPAADADHSLAPEADAEESKEDLAQLLGRLVRGVPADDWKAAPTGDLALLSRAIAIGTLGTDDGAPRHDSAAGIDRKDLDELTKKALHQRCIDLLRTDLDRQASADSNASPQQGHASARSVRDSLDAEDALDGLSRLNKATLVALAAFLQGS